MCGAAENPSPVPSGVLVTVKSMIYSNNKRYSVFGNVCKKTDGDNLFFEVFPGSMDLSTFLKNWTGPLQSCYYGPYSRVVVRSRTRRVHSHVCGSVSGCGGALACGQGPRARQCQKIGRRNSLSVVRARGVKSPPQKNRHGANRAAARGGVRDFANRRSSGSDHRQPGPGVAARGSVHRRRESRSGTPFAFCFVVFRGYF